MIVSRGPDVQNCPVLKKKKKKYIWYICFHRVFTCRDCWINNFSFLIFSYRLQLVLVIINENITVLEALFYLKLKLLNHKNL